jgi:hypothetical protein
MIEAPILRLNHALDQCWSSPTRRRMVTASVIRLGARISFRRIVRAREVVSVIQTRLGFHAAIRPRLLGGF